MATVSTLVDQFLESERPISVLLDTGTVLAQAVAATRFYAGYAQLSAYEDISYELLIAGDTELSTSEWALIRPLFLLYLEREEAKQLEASRGLGVDVFGRVSSEIAADITQYELDLPHKAFFMAIQTI